MELTKKQKYLKAYYLAHKERIRELQRLWNKAHSELRRRLNKEWVKNNPERRREIARLSERRRYKPTGRPRGSPKKLSPPNP